MKNKIFNFVLDLFKNGDKEEQAGIFAQVKIYRSTSARVFEVIVGILVLAMWLLTIRNIIHATSDDLPYLLLLAGMGTFFPIACLLHSYHPKANDFPFVKIVNARQVYYLSLNMLFKLGNDLFFFCRWTLSLCRNRILFSHFISSLYFRL